MYVCPSGFRETCGQNKKKKETPVFFSLQLFFSLLLFRCRVIFGRRFSRMFGFTHSPTFPDSTRLVVVILFCVDNCVAFFENRFWLLNQ